MSIADTIIYGSLSELELKLKQDPNLNFVDEYGFTPLVKPAL